MYSRASYDGARGIIILFLRNIVQSTVSGLLKDSNPLFQDNDILGKSKFCLLVGKTAIGAKYGNFGVAQFWWSRLYVYKFTEKRVLLIESTGRFE